MSVPETRYAKSGDVDVAYQVCGDGPLDLLCSAGWVTNVEVMREEARHERFLRRLASFSRLILLDERGTGPSDRVPNEDETDDGASLAEPGAPGARRRAQTPSPWYLPL